jgi:hypothetical protein
MPFPTLEAAADLEERTRKDLELDRKDAELELHHYEDAGLLLDVAERTMDILRFIQQGDLYSAAQQHISNHARSTTNSEVYLHARSPQFYRGLSS